MKNKAAPMPSADLEAAIAFVIERMSQEAERQAKPLDEDEIYFLNHLPTEPTNPNIPGGVADEYGPPIPVLRDFPFERLCSLAKNAHRTDIQNRPDAAGQCNFAASVLNLNRHPMSSLLGWVGIKTKKSVTLQDGILLVLTAFSVVIVGLIGGMALLLFTEGYVALWRRTLCIMGALIYAGLMILLYFGVKRVEKWQAVQTVERYRCLLPLKDPWISRL